MILIAASIFLFAALFFRIAKTSSGREKLLFYFISVLYALPLALVSLNPALPQWVPLAVAAAVVFGAAFFVLDFFWSQVKRRWEASKKLKDLRKQKGPLYELLAAARLLSEASLGALIIFERKRSLERWCSKGVRIDARLSREILFSIFSPPGALHDGATIVRAERVLAAGVIVPLTKNPYLSKELGTRHRAAIGMSEVTDALCLVVSEETGSISLADRGYLHYDVPLEKLPEFFERAARFKLSRKKWKSPPFEAVPPEPVRAY